jgi:Zn-dependent peptidase ImmA (M78 family)
MNGRSPRRFAEECEEIALEARAELGLDSQARLDPRRLAKHLGIEVVSIKRYRHVCPAAVKQLTERDKMAFSAGTVFRKTRCMILVNPVHSPKRESNSIAHELAHLMLEHEPMSLLDGAGRRNWREEDEGEAHYLAGALLVPESGVAPVLDRMDWDLRSAADHFGVSDALMQIRIEVSGAGAGVSTPIGSEAAGELTTTLEEELRQTDHPAARPVFRRLRIAREGTQNATNSTPATSPAVS